MKSFIIRKEEIAELLETYNSISRDVWKDYGINDMTEKQWQKKYPGIPKNRAAGKAVDEWCMYTALNRCSKSIIVEKAK